MRSDQIHYALSRVINRFEVCSLVAKGVRRTHKTGSRFEDSINDMLQFIGTHEKMHTAEETALAKKVRPAA
jgi:hypothetical protein